MRHSIKIALIATLTIGSVFSVWPPKSHLNSTEIIPEIPAPVALITLSIPVELFIRSIGIDAHIEPVGVLDSGAMAVPALPDDVGWYTLGTRPGDIGSAVFDGHVNWIHRQTAVFGNLHKLKTNDTVSVLDTYGTTNYFTVHEIKKYPFNADTSEIFSSHDGLSHLNIITCDETSWNTITKTDDMRLVVFTEKI